MAGVSLRSPSPWVFEYVDLLYELYGPVRSEWPPGEDWPVPWWPVPDGA
jgi:hypothetical protein